MKVRDVMSEQVECVRSDTPIIEAAKIMQKSDVGSVPVCDNKRLLGIVTDRDIVVRGIASHGNPMSLNAGQVMSTDVVTVTPDTDVHQASALMSDHQVRRLPVVERGEICGMLALGDLAVERVHVDEAGEALSDISHGIQH
ncbi:CBS domain protein [Acididesulfobacillus acetoxydans]|uniref:CBS domain pair protein n=1 Tax=Acididesulfobacillus acetoxydans TaxID=1561005 RepID=A0A8S0WFI1_9FIRM|nr:CBS domain-containing protein [Acididesulfobacillus acetoxydans]CAA7601062.1 CBS domain protein [Acididesulfobacillus acetoxydans]CEJ06936.1 CBS domain pair protein [Acididesulfobacillus acetoxydans]